MSYTPEEVESFLRKLDRLAWIIASVGVIWFFFCLFVGVRLWL